MLVPALLTQQAFRGRRQSRLSRPVARAAKEQPLSNVVLGTSDGHIVHVPPGERPRATRLHTHRIRDIVHVAEAEAFATCSDDGTVRMWRNGEAVMGGVFYTSAPVVRLLPVSASLLALDEQGRVCVRTCSRPPAVG